MSEKCERFPDPLPDPQEQGVSWICRPSQNVLAEVLAEREAQETRWGNTHDDSHGPNDWLALVVRHAGRAAFDGSQFRRRMVVVAALAVAAVEWHDRAAIRVRAGFDQQDPFVDYEGWDAWMKGGEAERDD